MVAQGFQKGYPKECFSLLLQMLQSNSLSVKWTSDILSKGQRWETLGLQRAMLYFTVKRFGHTACLCTINQRAVYL